VAGLSLPSAPLFRALTGLPQLALSPTGFSLGLVALLSLLWLLWLAALWLAGRASSEAQGRARALVRAGGVALLAWVVVLVPPVLSSDLYRQASYGHMVARWGRNPYATRASDVPGNPLLPFAEQTQITTIYGPAYTLVSAVAAGLTPPSPLCAALAWKTLSALAALGMALLAARLARTLDAGRGEDVRPTLLLLWNPLVIVEAAGSGHVEPVMMLPALAGVLLLVQKRGRAGIALVALSSLTKWLTAILLALALARETAAAPPGQRWRTFAGRAGTAALVTALCYLPFAPGLLSRGGIHELMLHAGAPLGSTARGWLPPPLALLVFVALATAIAYRAWSLAWPRLLAVAAGLMLGFMVLVVPWLFPWYWLAPMALVAVLPRDRPARILRLSVFALGAGVMLHYARLVPLP
jgi:hypothetical protein